MAGFVMQEMIELEALNAELRKENARLHEALEAERKRSEALSDYCARGWRRVWVLNKRVWRLIALAKFYRDAERKPGRPARPRSAYRERMMIMRYIHLDGRERGKGKRVKAQVAQEFKGHDYRGRAADHPVRSEDGDQG